MLDNDLFLNILQLLLELEFLGMWCNQAARVNLYFWSACLLAVYGVNCNFRRARFRGMTFTWSL